MSTAPVSPATKRVLVCTTAALALASGAFFGLAASGKFMAARGAPPILALTIVVLALAALLPLRRAARGTRILLAALTVALAVGGLLAHARLERERGRLAAREATRALAGRTSPPLRFDRAFNVAAGAQARFPATGRVTLIDFWATWCAPCREHIPELEKLARDEGKRGLDVVGVTTFYGKDRSAAGRRAELREIEAFLRDNGMTYPILVASGMENHEAFRVVGLPTVALVDRNGTVVDYGLGSVGSKAVVRRAVAMLDER